MNILNSNVASHILKTSETSAGKLYFFNHIAAVEFNEGIHVDLNTARDTIHELISYFGQSRPFGLVANRVNSYSISLLDVEEVKSVLPNIASYGVVSHNSAGEMNAKIENSFCETQRIHFRDLYECLDIVYQKVKDTIMVSLN